MALLYYIQNLPQTNPRAYRGTLKQYRSTNTDIPPLTVIRQVVWYQIGKYSNCQQSTYLCKSICLQNPTNTATTLALPTINDIINHLQGTYSPFYVYYKSPAIRKALGTNPLCTHGSEEHRGSTLTSRPSPSAVFWAGGPQSAGCSVLQWYSSPELQCQSVHNYGTVPLHQHNSSRWVSTPCCFCCTPDLYITSDMSLKE